MAPVSVIKTVAARNGATPAQLAQEWLLAQKPWIVPIPSTTRLQRIEEILGAVDLQLSQSDLADIDAEAPKVKIQDERLPEAASKMTGL